MRKIYIYEWKFNIWAWRKWIAIALRMSETLAGVTIVAIGNAGPDIASSFAAFGSRSAEQSGWGIEKKKIKKVSRVNF